MGYASLIMQAGGAISSGIGSYFQASAQKDTLKTQARIADINATVAEQQAQSALQQGEKAQQAIMLRGAEMKASQRAGFAAHGVDLSSPTVAHVLTSTDTMTEIDKNTANANAVRQAWGYRLEGVNQQNKATMAEAQASGISPFASAATSLMGGAGRVADSWYKLSKSSGFDSTKPVLTDKSSWADVQGAIW
jgi:hypothetical protein